MYTYTYVATIITAELENAPMHAWRSRSQASNHSQPHPACDQSVPSSLSIFPSFNFRTGEHGVRLKMDLIHSKQFTPLGLSTHKALLQQLMEALQCKPLSAELAHAYTLYYNNESTKVQNARR